LLVKFGVRNPNPRLDFHQTFNAKEAQILVNFLIHSLTKDRNKTVTDDPKTATVFSHKSEKVIHRLFTVALVAFRSDCRFELQLQELLAG